jgi:hypothetical protein
MDRACAYHDCCLTTVCEYLSTEHHRKCNSRFCASLGSMDCSNSRDPDTCERYRSRALQLCLVTIGGSLPLP